MHASLLRRPKAGIRTTPIRESPDDSIGAKNALDWSALKKENGGIVCTLNQANELKTNPSEPQKGRTERFLRGLKSAVGEGLPIRVIVGDRTKGVARVQKRMLDPIPWAVVKYDQPRGEYLLRRGARPVELGGNTVPGRGGASRGWPCAPDSAHNAAVEAAAIDFVRRSCILGKEKYDRQKDNCGWDLEFTRDGLTLCIEVKGLSGAVLSVELSPNEYAAMKRAMDKSFPEGEYRLAVVRNALTTPELLLFSHAGRTDWMCEITSKQVSVTQSTGARIGEMS
jgi:hypothetical protein